MTRSNPPDPRIAEIRALAEAAKASTPNAPYTGLSWQRVLDALDNGSCPFFGCDLPNGHGHIWPPSVVPGLTGGVTSGVGDERQTGESVNPAVPDQPDVIAVRALRSAAAQIGSVYDKPANYAEKWLFALAAEIVNQAGVVPDPTPKPELRTPQEWAALDGIRIIDADGWRLPNSPRFDAPIPRAEYVWRVAICTIDPRGGAVTTDPETTP